MMHLRNAVVIVTGASSGIGRETARVLSQAGAHVALVARNAAALESLARELEPNGSQTLVIPADIASPDAARQIVEAVMARWNRIDILINNAGLGIQANVAQLPDDQLHSVFEVNLFGPIRLIQAALLHMDHSMIVNVSSPVAPLAFPGVSGYAATKAALDVVSNTLRRELWGRGIRVLSVYPGRIDTNFDQARIRVQGSQRVARSPVRGSAQQVAHAIKHGIERQRRDVYILQPIERLVINLHRLAPRLFDPLIGWWFERRTKQHR